MLKHIYRGIILVAIFVGALVYFGSNIKDEEVKVVKTINMSKATFPVLYIKSDKENINLLHGYSSNVEENLIRDSITPINEDKTISAVIDEKKNVVKKIDYEISQVSDGNIIDSGSMYALEEKGDKKIATIRIKADLTENTEYAFKITAVTDTSKKIHYYTRLKYFTGSHVSENIDFIKNFHDSILDAKKAKDIVIYLESDMTKENDSFSHVTINSSFDLVSFKGLKPKVVNDIVPTIIETNADVTTVELKYIIKTTSGKKELFYNVKETYRVRYTAGRMYLLNYDRTMESIFDMSLSDLTKNEINIGITNKDDFGVVTSSDNKKLSFVKDRSLWYYNLVQNKAVNVFSFESEDLKDSRETYDDHDIRVLNLEDNGDMDFMVYGYMNRGYYEGRVAIVLYKYYSKENRIEEQVYIPIDIPYQMLKENIDSFSYVNQAGVFYFSINQTIYAYNILGQDLRVIATNIDSDNLYLSKQGKFIAWQDNNNAKKAKSIIILDLETGKQNEIKAPENSNIKILGSIEGNIIYGFAKTSDIVKDVDGSVIVPLNKVQIADSNGNLLKKYHKKTAYVVGTTVKDNVIELSRVKKVTSAGKDSYSKIKPDYILNNTTTSTLGYTLTKKSSTNRLLESYILIPSMITIGKQPTVKKTMNTVITADTTLHLDFNDISNKYYVYALGEITNTYKGVGDAIFEADSKYGVVLNNKQQTIWERGEKNTRSSLNIEPVYVSQNVDSVGACLKMVLNHVHINASATDLTNREGSIYELLTKYLKNDAINLTGANLDQVLYYVSKGYPIIAMKDKTHAVIIKGYDEFNITVIDPGSMKTSKIGLSDANKLFENSGNIFISYQR